MLLGNSLSHNKFSLFAWGKENEIIARGILFTNSTCKLFGTDANIQDLGETSTKKKLYHRFIYLSSFKQKLFTSNRSKGEEARRGDSRCRRGGSWRGVAWGFMNPDSYHSAHRSRKGKHSLPCHLHQHSLLVKSRRGRAA